MTAADYPAERLGRAGGNDAKDRLVRVIAWGNLAALAMFLVQTWLVQIMGLPAPGTAFTDGGAVAWILLLAWPAAVLGAAAMVVRTPVVGLREDADRISAFNGWLVRALFFCVLYVGIVDAVISFLRVEEMLEGLFGEALASELSRPLWRGPWIHMPLIALGALTAFFTRTLGFTWLALLIVAAELCIVISRFVFSYEQAFMGDLVRFWYAALFLFASAYTLLDEGHVRVDVFYASFRLRTKGVVNAVGALALGIVFCWVILSLGMAGRSSIIMAPLLSFEVSQNTTGMFVKYLMAGFLAAFAVTMLIQFCAMLLDAVADARGEPGHKEHLGAAAS